MSHKKKKQKITEDWKSLTTDVSDDNGTQSAEDILKEGKKDCPRTLFVRALHPNTTTDKLAEHFSQVAVLKHAVAVSDKGTGQCRGYGFVTFADSDDAAAARDALNGTLFEGRIIQISAAEPRHRRVSSRGLKVEDEAGQTTHDRGFGRNHIAGGQREFLHENLPRLIIRNLPWTVNKPEQLSRIFMSYGKVKNASLPKDQRGQLRGFGFVLFRGRKNAEKAISGLNGKIIDGRTLAVDWAAPKDIWTQSQQDQSESNILHQTATKELEHSDTLTCSSVPPEFDCTNDPPFSDIGKEDDVSIINPHCKSDENVAELRRDITNEDRSSTIFVRNLPFRFEDSDLFDHFRSFGPVRYARIVMDYNPGGEGRSRGTGFVNFYRIEDAQRCLQEAPRINNKADAVKDRVEPHRSVLEDTRVDSEGFYTIGGRVLQVSQCVEKSRAQQLQAENRGRRDKKDARHLFLLREGMITHGSPLFNALNSLEIRMREASTRQRQDLIKKNPSLFISLTRLAIRNIPRFVNAKDLKALARQAVVGFATDVKEGRRQPLSSEERNRSDEGTHDAEQKRRAKGKGIVKQAKIVYESLDGRKVVEKDATGRSRGYGFVEYTSHRCALMGLRWLNGHLISQSKETTYSPISNQAETPKRLIVEFAIENAQVVQRRKDKETNPRHWKESTNVSKSIGPDQKSDLKEERNGKASKANCHRPQKDTQDSGDMGDKGIFQQKIIGRKRAKRKMRSF